MNRRPTDRRLAEVTIDDSLNTMAVSITFVGLAGPATASHIQCCTAAAFTGTAGVAAPFPTFPALTSGTFTLTYDLTSLATYNPAFITASGGTAADAEATLLAGLAGELAYVNIHDSINPGGEIRGFLAPAVPEPATFGLTGLALVGLLALRSRIAA